MYHDVVEPDDHDSSGFPGLGPARDKVESPRSERHLAAIERRGKALIGVTDVAGPTGPDRPLLSTFDDGGASCTRIGSELARAAWIGHYFVAIALIGLPGSWTRLRSQVWRTRAPGRNALMLASGADVATAEADLVREWRQSIDVLRAITGGAVVAWICPRRRIIGRGWCVRRRPVGSALSSPPIRWAWRVRCPAAFSWAATRSWRGLVPNGRADRVR